MINIIDLVPNSKPFKMQDLNGRVVQLEYKETEYEKDTLKLLTARDMNTHDVYIIFYELGVIKEDA